MTWAAYSTIDKEGILWEACSVTCIIVDLHKALTALEALLVPGAETLIAGRVAPYAHIVVRVFEEAQ
jgi:hypothetical protein